jgi:hypothetical protein
MGNETSGCVSTAAMTGVVKNDGVPELDFVVMNEMRIEIGDDSVVSRSFVEKENNLGIRYTELYGKKRLHGSCIIRGAFQVVTRLVL